MALNLQHQIYYNLSKIIISYNLTALKKYVINIIAIIGPLP